MVNLNLFTRERLFADPFEFEEEQQVSPKYVKDGKKYGRHSRPGTDTEGDLSESLSKTSSTTRGLTRQKNSVGVRSALLPLLGPFPIMWCCRNGIEYNSSTSSSPVRPPPLTPHFPYLFYTSLSTWFSVFLSISFLVLAHLIFFLVCALRPFSLICPYDFILFSVISFVTGATLPILSHVRF